MMDKDPKRTGNYLNYLKYEYSTNAKLNGRTVYVYDVVRNDLYGAIAYGLLDATEVVYHMIANGTTPVFDTYAAQDQMVTVFLNDMGEPYKPVNGDIAQPLKYELY
jgi:hypothetical protein